MNLSFEMLKPVVKPIVLEIYKSVLLPELMKLDGQVGSPELKIIADALLEAIEKVVPAELDKL